MLTEPTPGLPYIAALGTDVSRHARALAGAIAGLAPEVGEALGLVGFAALDPRGVCADRAADGRGGGSGGLTRQSWAAMKAFTGAVAACQEGRASRRSIQARTFGAAERSRAAGAR